MDNENKTKKKLYVFEKKILTVPVIALIFLGVFAVVVWRLSIKYTPIADFCSGTISFVMRFILTKTTYLLPFSLAELMLYACVPLLIFLIVRFIISKHKLTALLKFFSRTLALCGLIMFLFTFTLGVCYSTTPVNQKIGFERRLLDPEDLDSALEILVAEANEVAANINFEYTDEGSTIMPYGLNELNKKLNMAYINMLGKHDLFKRINAKVKPVMSSVQMSKMHITGVYAFFTGEANVNIDFPDYNLPFTAAHEMAHLMGVGKEDEANFTAFLVCLYSDDDYIRYSGIVNMLEYIGGALLDSERYYEIMKNVPPVVFQEMAAYSKFFNKYRNTEISKVAKSVNNSYLKVQGQEQGVKSYGFVVDLATVYLIDIYNQD